MSCLNDPSLDQCNCCGPKQITAPIYNRPGLPTLSYRSKQYASFFASMRSGLGALPLRKLTSRAGDDGAIALLDASSIIADVLTFYQERIANEGFMRTATERRSILELARAIGYELSPGVAASTYLAFTLEDAKDAPPSAEIPLGTRVQSVPGQGELPQIFETSETIIAHPKWNAIHPRLSEPQSITTDVRKIYLDGIATGLKVGDPVLLVEVEEEGKIILKRVTRVVPEAEPKRTVIEFEERSQSSIEPASSFVASASEGSNTPMGEVNFGAKIPLNSENVRANIVGMKWTDSKLNAFLTFNEWRQEELLDCLHGLRAKASSIGKAYALRTTIGFFGNNAPAFKSLPKTKDDSQSYGENWDGVQDGGGWEIWKDQQQVNSYYSSANAFLERSLTGLLADSWLVLEGFALEQTKSPTDLEATRLIYEAAGQNFDPDEYRTLGRTKTIAYYSIQNTLEKSLGAFAMSGKSTGLSLNRLNGSPIDPKSEPHFSVRNTVAHVHSEELALVEKPLEEYLSGYSNVLRLNDLVLGLHSGQALVLSGENKNAPGISVSEVLFIKTIDHIGGLTELTLVDGLQNEYKRDTVTINANLALATHGETVTEILGNGNGAQTNQRFTLKKPPLTYAAAPTVSGSASTAALRINNLLWDEAASLYPLTSNDQSYIIRTGDDGQSTVIFGDGERGARLPSGLNNVVATYRTGIGLGGEVKANSLSTLQTKPLGVKSVFNPLAASGAGDPEKIDNARANAPLTVRTLERIVSRLDYEDFAAAFAGIGKAQAIDFWSGERRLMHLTVAGENGEPIKDAKFLDNFRNALDAARDPTQTIRVDSFDKALFNVTVNVAIDPRYMAKDVLRDIETALSDSFSFSKRSFGQGITPAEVTTVIQKNEGVIYVDIEELYLATEPPHSPKILDADIAHIELGEIHLAQLLLVNRSGVSVNEVRA